MRLSRLAIFLLILLVNGCSHPPPLEKFSPPALKQGEPDLDHQKKLTKLHNWIAEGKLIAIHGSEIIHASFIWEQQGAFYKIRFFGPLGMSGGILMGNTDTQEVLFKTAQGKRLEASSPEKLVYQTTGLYLPVSHLSFWIKGLPHPDHPCEHQAYNSQGLLTILRQQAWTIQYIDYTHLLQNEKFCLPAYIKINSKQTTLKISISAWN